MLDLWLVCPNWIPSSPCLPSVVFHESEAPLDGQAESLVQLGRGRKRMGDKRVVSGKQKGEMGKGEKQVLVNSVSYFKI